MSRIGLLLAVVLFGASLSVAQLPAGTRSLDDRQHEERQHEDPSAAQMREAEAALEQRDYTTAEAKLKALLADHPEAATNGRILYDLGFAEERNGEEAEAAKSYAASAAALPGFAEPQVALGLLDARAGRVAAAHRELEAASKLEAASPELRARALRALAHMDQTEKPQLAEEELLAALKLTPETPDDVLLGAELAERTGDAADAETAYRRALVLLPDELDATVGLAHVLQQQSKLAEADALLTPALKAHPDDARLVAQTASLYASEGKAQEAIPLLEALRAKDPPVAADVRVTRMLASLYAVNGDDAAAAKLDLTLLKGSPDDAGLLDDLGQAQVRLGQYAEAETTLVHAVSLREAFHDDKAWALSESHLALAASKNKDPKTALAALAARGTVLPNSASSLFLQAISYDSLRQVKDAIAAYKAFLVEAKDKYPDETFEARHRLVALENVR
jgi:tetratricopeptide (TPR) repeat protein